MGSTGRLAGKRALVTGGAQGIGRGARRPASTIHFKQRIGTP